MKNLLTILALVAAVVTVGILGLAGIVGPTVSVLVVGMGSFVVIAVVVLSIVDYARDPDTKSKHGILPVLARWFTGVVGVVALAIGILILGWILYIIPQSSAGKAMWGIFLALGVWVPAVFWGVKLILMAWKR